MRCPYVTLIQNSGIAPSRRNAYKHNAYKAQRQRGLANSGTMQPPGYNPGITSQGQGYAPRITPGSGTIQTYAPGTFRQQ